MNYKEMQDSLSSDDIKDILEPFGKCVRETENYLIFPTFCHNKEGGSHKLYYYKNSHSFHCYTECDCNYNIFSLIRKIYETRGTAISFHEAISICGFDNSGANDISTERNAARDDIDRLYALNNYDISEPALPHYDKSILNRFVFDEKALSIWKQEGISTATMKKYHIAYDPIENCIIIPNYDLHGNLIGIRGRFLDENAYAKYRPIIYGGKVISHPSSSMLYGLNLTKEAIQHYQQAIIFESEKSVMKMDSIYGIRNVAVATLGQNISIEQIRLLKKFQVNEVVLAFDADYNNYSELDKVKNKYLAVAAKLKNFFNTSILIDWQLDQLQYKDAPIDRGKEIFEKLLSKRLYV